MEGGEIVTTWDRAQIDAFSLIKFHFHFKLKWCFLWRMIKQGMKSFLGKNDMKWGGRGLRIVGSDDTYIRMTVSVFRFSKNCCNFLIFLLIKVDWKKMLKKNLSIHESNFDSQNFIFSVFVKKILIAPF